MRQALTKTLKQETNSHDVHAVAVYYDDHVIAYTYIPYNIAPKVSKDVNKGCAQTESEPRSWVQTGCMDQRSRSVVVIYWTSIANL